MDNVVTINKREFLLYPNKYIKMLILDKGLRKELGESLHEYVNPRFSLNNVARQRIDFYKKVMQ